MGAESLSELYDILGKNPDNEDLTKNIKSVLSAYVVPKAEISEDLESKLIEELKLRLVDQDLIARVMELLRKESEG